MHIGILQYVYASILTLLVYHELPGSPNDNIKTVMQFLRQYWKRNPTPAHFRYIRLSMFSVDPDEGYPKLNGRDSDLEHLSKGLCACWDHYRVQNHEDPKYVPHMQILLLLKKLLECMTHWTNILLMCFHGFPPTLRKLCRLTFSIF